MPPTEDDESWARYMESLKLNDKEKALIVLLLKYGDLKLISPPLNSTQPEYLNALTLGDDHVGNVHRDSGVILRELGLVTYWTIYDHASSMQIYKARLKKMPTGVINQLLDEKDADILLEDMHDPDEPLEQAPSTLLDDSDCYSGVEYDYPHD